MTQCQRHSKDFIGNCQLCGKQLCRKCISLEEGKKKYCVNCAEKISEFRRIPKPDFLKEQHVAPPKSEDADEFRVEVY